MICYKALWNSIKINQIQKIMPQKPDCKHKRVLAIKRQNTRYQQKFYRMESNKYSHILFLMVAFHLHYKMVVAAKQAEFFILADIPQVMVHIYQYASSQNEYGFPAEYRVKRCS